MMGEHDAPTIARATVWLDTSNEAPTRRNERLEAHDTAPTAALEAPHDEPETSRYRPAEPPAETMTLEARSKREARRELEARACAPTETLEQAFALEQGLVRAARPREHAGRWLGLFGGAGALVAAFMIGRVTLHWQPSASYVAPPRPVRSAATPSASPPHRPEPVTPPPPRDHAPPFADAPSAVDALARGDYQGALGLYRSLAHEQPNHAAFATIVRLLAARQGRRCEAGQEGSPCGG